MDILLGGVYLPVQVSTIYSNLAFGSILTLAALMLQKLNGAKRARLIKGDAVTMA